ncbi:DNA polymerase/3'-5' exonuclease PolX [candidate division KSB1 bacterium]
MTGTISNKEAAKILEEIGVMLELLGENPFKARAHYSASRTIETLEEPFIELVETGTLGSIKGIGKGMNDKLTELAKTGKMSEYSKLKDSIPPGLWEILRIPGLGPKKVRDIFDKLKITTVGELEYACRENRLITLEGFGQKSQEKTLDGIEFLKQAREQHHIHNALSAADSLRMLLESFPEVDRSEITGEIRRHNEIINAADILVCSDPKDNDKIADRLSGDPEVKEIFEKSGNIIKLKHTTGIDARIIFAGEAEYAQALFQFTGSDEHVEKAITNKTGKKPEFDDSGIISNPIIDGCREEKDIYTSLGLSFIPPEIRENTGEIETAAGNTLPDLVTESDYTGVLHVHTTYSDGINTIEEMVQACIERGYKYLGICDHSRSAFYANGLTVERIKRQHEEIDSLREKYPDFSIFKGIESDILLDGSLDYPDNVLETFDFIVASVHSKLNMPIEEATERLENAVRNPYTTILGHPTGRLLLARKGYPLDMERILRTAKEHNVAIELNTNPFRLDLDWKSCRAAKKLALKIAVNPDAHSIEGLDDTRYGIGIARKGWLSPGDVLNTMPPEQIEEFFINRKISSV